MGQGLPGTLWDLPVFQGSWKSCNSPLLSQGSQAAAGTRAWAFPLVPLCAMHQCFSSPCCPVFMLLPSVLHHGCQRQRRELTVRGGAEGSAPHLSLHTSTESRQAAHITLPVTSRCPQHPAVSSYLLGSLHGTWVPLQSGTC